MPIARPGCPQCRPSTEGTVIAIQDRHGERPLQWHLTASAAAGCGTYAGRHRIDLLACPSPWALPSTYAARARRPWLRQSTTRAAISIPSGGHHRPRLPQRSAALMALDSVSRCQLRYIYRSVLRRAGGLSIRICTLQHTCSTHQPPLAPSGCDTCCQCDSKLRRCGKRTAVNVKRRNDKDETANDPY